jgi:hypothetical protein
MSDVTLILGPVEFSGFEIPPAISFGGAQRLTVHKLPGGARIIDSLGRDDAPILWEGIFTGSNAVDRARVLDVLRAEGGVLPLIWDSYFYSVVISFFEADYRNEFWIPYRIACTVLRDEVEAVFEQAASMLAQVTSDFSTAAGYAGIGGVDLGGATAALGAPGAMTLGTSGYGNTVSAVSAAQNAIASQLSSAETSIIPLGAALVPGNVSGALASLGTAQKSTGTMANLAVAQGYVNRTAVNLSHASS